MEKDYVGVTLENKYLLTAKLGQGGMGSVYKGQHALIGKTVAVKFLHARFVGQKQVVQRFYREARAAAAIGHDNIIDVFDVGISPEGDPFLVMEYLEGESLADMLDRVGPLSVEAACGVMEPALLALSAAHAKGIVHRDLKPDNIFVAHKEGAPPKVKLIDFGISKVADGAEKLTRTGSVMGTPAYMAPEQARGDAALDHRADVYAMGVILYELLTGALPFPGDTFASIMARILTEKPLPPLEVRPDLPRGVQTIIMTTLEKDPARRYQSAAALLAALKSLDGFDSRIDHLTTVAGSALQRTFASGDLGEKDLSSRGGPSVAGEVLAEVMQSSTPAGWADSKPGAASGRPKKKTGIIAASISVAVISVLGAAFAVWVGNSKSAVEPSKAMPVLPVPAKVLDPVSAQESANKPAKVKLTVIGAPAGAKIFYDGAEREGQAFEVKRDTAIRKVFVEAPGRDKVKLLVVPSEDRILHYPDAKKDAPKGRGR